MRSNTLTRVSNNPGAVHNTGTLMTSPAAFILDKRGNIRWKHIGRGPLDWPRVPRILEELRKI